MAYSDKDPSAETASLARRFPKRGIDPTIPANVRAAMVQMEKERERKKAGERYDEIMPSPEPGEAAPKKARGGKVKGYAKGGFVRSADGCAQHGKTRGKFV